MFVSYFFHLPLEEFQEKETFFLMRFHFPMSQTYREVPMISSRSSDTEELRTKRIRHELPTVGHCRQLVPALVLLVS